MNKIQFIILAIYFLSACSQKKTYNNSDTVIAKGQMPNITMDKNNTLHLVYGSGDSIMYSYSSNNGNSFSAPSVISVLHGVYAFATRGPQIAATNNNIIVTASTSAGDIFSFCKDANGKWAKGSKVNDVDAVAKEGLMALSANKNFAYAVWLDLRGDKHNKIYGAKSLDGGKTWLKNNLVYFSPDSTVCECCKPSVIINGSRIYVMFRNWLKGNRDLYLVQSADGGSTFGKEQKLGVENWKLDGCPMDGGGLVIDNNGVIQTVWRRKGKIFSSKPGMHEIEIGEGRSCTIETINGKNIYAWTENGEVVFLNPQLQKKVLGKGSLPVLKAVNNEQVICVWENNNQIHAFLVKI